MFIKFSFNLNSFQEEIDHYDWISFFKIIRQAPSID